MACESAVVHSVPFPSLPSHPTPFFPVFPLPPFSATTLWVNIVPRTSRATHYLPQAISKCAVTEPRPSHSCRRPVISDGLVTGIRGPSLEVSLRGKAIWVQRKAASCSREGPWMRWPAPWASFQKPLDKGNCHFTPLPPSRTPVPSCSSVPSSQPRVQMVP